MILRLAPGLTAGTLLLVFVVLALGVVGGLGAEACGGQVVSASWYGRESGQRTATGAAFDGTQWLVAHRSLPFGTTLRLSYHGRTVTVPVGDRGPYVAGRTLDLSEAVARALGTKHAGVARVCLERAKN